MNKTNLKIYIVLVIIFGIIGISAFVISNKITKETKELNSYVVIDSDCIFQYNDNKWIDVGSMKNIAMNKFKVYLNNNYIGNYYVSKGQDKYYFFDKDYNSQQVESPFIAISANSSLSLIDYKDSEFDNSDYSIIKNYFKKINIKYNGNYSVQRKYIVDLNNDSKDDSIYILSNQLYSDKIFYIVFAKVNNKYITIDKQLNSENIINYELGWVLNISKNGMYDIVLRYSNGEFYNYYLYETIKKDEYQKIF